jgi:tRNA A-37 threonylcarbamoyl transferase component Bud32
MVPAPPQRVSADVLLGQMLGSYRLDRVLGEGGMGAVYEGVHPVIGARVAIKVLRPEVAANPAVVERFFNEARAVNLIGHRNVVRILDLASERGYYFCVMELLEGEPLSARLSGGKRMPFSVAGPILLQCAEALEAAHQRKIIHRDIKPDNVFLVRETGQRDLVKVVDFGIAKLTASGLDVQRTSAGVVMGTPAYMSPEQAEGAAELDGRSDIYSLGVMMFQMATGRLPFLETAHVQVMMAHLTTQPPLPTAIAPQTPKALERLILRCLSKAPAERYPSMAALHDALRAAMAECGLEADGASLQGATVPSLEAAPVDLRLPPPPAIPPMGTGMEGEPLPGAEMFEALAAVEPSPVDPFARAAGEEPFSKVAGTASVLDGQPGPSGLELAIAPRPAQQQKPAPRPLLAESEPLELDLPRPGERSPYAAQAHEVEQPLGAGVVGEVPQAPKRSAGGVLLALGLVACVGVVVLVLADKPAAPAVPARAPALAPTARQTPANDDAQEMKPSGAVPPAARAEPPKRIVPAPGAAKHEPLTCPPKSVQTVGNGPSVTLQIRTVPEGADVRAQWPGGGCKVGVAPLLLEVPKDAQVHLLLRAEGLATHEFDVPADNARLIVENLTE